MHDGQNLFIPDISHTGVTWGIAEAINKLSVWGFIQPAIVVGIGNTSNRFGDYLPTKPFKTKKGKAYLETLKVKDPGFFTKNAFVSDNYLQLIINKIKPMIDNNFRTKDGHQDTIVMGSSMGGLISLYALVEYPNVFGKAGCLSTHWPVVGEFIGPYLQKYLPKAGIHKLYFDHGTQGLDANYGPFQEMVDNILSEKGHKRGVDWMTRIAPGAEHNEIAWRDRLHIPLRFLLKAY
jgi:predicted alpha/beta superfamily hydrolase